MLGTTNVGNSKALAFDPSITKSFLLNADGSKSIQFRMEIFNAFNHPNFAIPEVGNLTVFTGVDSTGKGILNPTAGQITRTSTPSRQIQFSLRLVF